MTILVVLADRGMEMELVQATEKAWSLKLGGHHNEDAIFVHHLRKTSSSNV
jgi:hypothetical protein